jgi:CheY-like chemotaxis protein
MPNGGSLTIATSNRVLDEQSVRAFEDLKAGDFVAVKVTDTGHGMAEAVRDRIFEPFFTTKKIGEGTGLGLSMVFGVVKQSEGHIAVSSQPQAGTSFEILLPRCRDGESDKSRRASETGLETRGDATILLVEDDDDVRSLISETLAAKGYKVLEAGNGEMALAMSASVTQDIHLLITDVIMPRMGGRELAERLCRQRPDLRVIFMSGYADDALHGALEDRPGLAFLEKPFTSARLTSMVSRCLIADR